MFRLAIILRSIVTATRPSRAILHRLLREHHLHKFVVIDNAVAILISFADHFVDLGVGQLLAQVC